MKTATMQRNCAISGGPRAVGGLAPRQAARPRQPCCAVAAADPQPSVSEDERAQRVRQEATRRIKTLGSQGRAKDAIAELAGLAKLGVQPDALAATTLVRACSKDMVLAQSVFDELFADFLVPDEIAYAVLLRGYGARSPPDWPRIDSTLTAMRMKHGIDPSATSYNVLLEVCVRTNDVDRGQDIIDRMAADEVEPDEFTEEVVARRRVLRSYFRKAYP